jgi:capsular exopolysaccharide synthesis family protein
MNLLLGGGLGAALVLAVAFVVEVRDDMHTQPQKLAQFTNSPLLGVIPADTSQPGELGTLVEPDSPFSEAIRSLRTNLQYASPDKPIQKLLVTSTFPDEGKSTIVANLAISLAQLGRKVIVMDADMRKSSQHKIFDIPSHHGLSEVMLHGQLENSLTQIEGVDDLFVLPAGKHPPNPAELITSQRMIGLLDECLEKSDLLIIDTPPVSAVTDAAALSPQVDGVLLVTRQNKTTWKQLSRTKELIDLVGGKVFGIVFNDF